MPSTNPLPITVALVDDYDIVLAGVAQMFAQYQHRVLVVELDANMPVEQSVDIVLYDSFAQAEADDEQITTLINNPRAGRVVIYTWNFQPGLVERACRQGIH